MNRLSVALALFLTGRLSLACAQGMGGVCLSPDGDSLYLYGTAIVRDSGGRAGSPAPALLGTAPGGFIATTTWGPEVRLTFTSDTASMSSPPRIVSRQDTLMMTLGIQYVDRPYLPFLLYSLDRGYNWLPLLGISNPDTGQGATNLFINLFNGRLNTVGRVSWPQEYDYQNIYTKRSSDLGQTWSQPYFFFSLGQQFIGMYGGTSHAESLIVAFRHGVARHDRQVDTLKYITSFDNGTSWSPPDPIMYYDQDNYWFWLRYSMGRIHLLFQQRSPTTNITEIFYKHSDDWGQTWSEMVAVSDDSMAISQWGYLFATDDGRLCASWFDYKYGSGGGGFTGDVLYRISLDNGESWGPELRLTYHQLGIASRSFILENTIGIVWEDARTGFFTPELYYAESSDMGQSWGDEVRLTEAQGSSDQPELMIWEDNLYLLWMDSRDNTSLVNEIYFRRANILVGIDNEDEEMMPRHIKLSCYPNPFNAATTLTLAGADMAQIEIVDIAGRRVAQLHAEGGKAVWQAKGLSSGVYFARVVGKGKSAGIKLIYLK